MIDIALFLAVLEDIVTPKDDFVVYDTGYIGDGLRANRDYDSGGVIGHYDGLRYKGYFEVLFPEADFDGLETPHALRVVVDGRVTTVVPVTDSVGYKANHACWGGNMMLRHDGVFVARFPIRRGDVLLWDYRQLHAKGDAPVPCLCGAYKCQGTISRLTPAPDANEPSEQRFRTRLRRLTNALGKDDWLSELVKSWAALANVDHASVEATADLVRDLRLADTRMASWKPLHVNNSRWRAAEGVDLTVWVTGANGITMLTPDFHQHFLLFRLVHMDGVTDGTPEGVADSVARCNIRG